MKKLIIGAVVVVLLGIAGYFIYQTFFTPAAVITTDTTHTPTDGGVVVVPEDKTKTVLGKSVEGRDIVAYHYGNGTTTELLLVGGIHGGYEWNTTLVAYELMDYLTANPAKIPNNIKVTVVPVLNPDGLYKTVGTTSRFSVADVPTPQSATVAGRFNANNVDLNRNFDCDWQATGKWQSTNVSGGATAFSEPESRAMKAYVESRNPTAVVVWYSAAGGVFASSCHNGILPETATLTKKFADASGYPAFQNFNFYEITGDMVNWLAKEKIPAISVLLTTHTGTEWEKNRKGIEALLTYYTK